MPDGERHFEGHRPRRADALGAASYFWTAPNIARRCSASRCPLRAATSCSSRARANGNNGVAGVEIVNDADCGVFRHFSRRQDWNWSARRSRIPRLGSDGGQTFGWVVGRSAPSWRGASEGPERPRILGVATAENYFRARPRGTNTFRLTTPWSVPTHTRKLTCHTRAPTYPHAPRPATHAPRPATRAPRPATRAPRPTSNVEIDDRYAAFTVGIVDIG